MKETLNKVAVLIRELGFKGSGQNFYRVETDTVSIVNLQKSSGSNGFYINLGVHPLVLMTGEKVPQKTKEYECLFRDRISPPRNEARWDYDLTDDDLKELKNKLVESNSQFFATLGNIKNDIKLKNLEELLPSNKKITVYGMRNAAKCYELSVLADAYDLSIKANDFAQKGLEICNPSAKGLLAKLKKRIAMQ